MDPELIKKLEEYGLKVSDLSAEKIAELTAIWNNALAKQKPTPTPTKPKDGEQYASLSPEDAAKITELGTAIGAITESIKGINAFISDQNKSREDSQKADREKRYKDGVEGAVKDGRLTRAKADELLKPEAMAVNVPAIDVFLGSLTLLAPDPRLAKGQDKGAEGGAPAAKTPDPSPTSIADLRRSAMEEVAAKLVAKP